jgi:hypothetical protein
LINIFPLLESRFLIIQLSDFNSERAVFSTWSVLTAYKQGTRLELSKFAIRTRLSNFRTYKII